MLRLNVFAIVFLVVTLCLAIHYVNGDIGNFLEKETRLSFFVFYIGIRGISTAI